MDSTVALFSSSRRNGNTGQLMDRIARELKIEVIDLGKKNITGYDYEHKNRGDDFKPLMEFLLGFKNLIFASPVYWYAVSPPMKIFLDRISDYLVLPDLKNKGRQLRGKRAYVVCTSIQPVVSEIFIGAFRETFQYLGMQFKGFIHVDCREGYVETNCEKEIDKFVHGIARN